MGNNTFDDEVQEALAERADLERRIVLRDEKDKKLITKFYIDNPEPDVYSIIELITKKTSRKSDKDFMIKFKELYDSDKLDLKSVQDYKDYYELYREELKKSGGKADV